MRGASPIHGRSHTPEHNIWSYMVRRCRQTDRRDYPRYGGRGVRVDPSWMGPVGFIRFLDHVGMRPSPRHQIDRIDPKGHYEPGNVRWVTPTVQQRNRTNNVRCTFQGETVTVAEWSERTGIGEATIHWRLNRGWSVDDALTRPVRRRARP